MDNKKIRLQIKRELRFIYNSLDVLDAYNPYRTPEHDRDRIAGTQSRCYMLVDFCEALDADGIITHDLYMDTWSKCTELLQELTKRKNALLSA